MTTTTEVKELIVWFIGADTTSLVKKDPDGNTQTIKLPKAKPHVATRKEIIRFLRRLPYLKPSKKPSKRAVYKWLKELQKQGLTKIKSQIETRGRPLEILELTDKGKRKCLLINEKFKSRILLKGPNEILFTMGPKREYLTMHVITHDRDLIETVWREIAKVTKESGFPLQGRRQGDVFFKNHPIFNNIATLLFLSVEAVLKMRGTSLEANEKTHDAIHKVMELVPFLQTMFNAKKFE